MSRWVADSAPTSRLIETDRADYTGNMSGQPGQRAIQVAVVAIVLLCAALATSIGLHAWARVGTAWPGFGMLPSGTLAPLALAPTGSAEALHAIGFNDRLVAIDGAPADGTTAFAHAERVGPDVPVRYRFERKRGDVIDVVVPTARFTSGTFLEICLPFLLGGMFGILLGAIVVFARPESPTARVFFVFNVGIALNFGLMAPDAYVVHVLPRWGFVGAGIGLGALAHLALLAPTPRWPLTRHPRPTLTAIYVIAAIATALLGSRSTFGARGFAILLALAATGLVANVATTALAGRDAAQRRMATVLLPPMLLFLASFAAFIGANGGYWLQGTSVVLFLIPLWILGVVSAYAIAAHNLFELDNLFRRMLTVGIVALAAIALDVGLFALLRLWLEPAAAWAAAGVAVVLAVTIVPASTPLRPGVERFVDRLFFPRQRLARRTLRETSRRLARLLPERELVGLLRETVERVTTCASVRLVVGERGGALREVAPVAADAAVELAPGEALVALFGRGTTLSLDAADAQRPATRAARQRAAALDVRLAVPLPATETRVGALLLGARADGRMYTRDDELVLETLAAQAASALENARAWDEVRRLEQRLAAENLYLREEAGIAAGSEADAAEDYGIVGRSPAIRQLVVQIEQVAPSDATILVTGETGTGKELVVRALHAASKRRERVLVRIACAAVPEPLLESELFGYERGAFTGATGRRVGRFEVADGGTLFLDDVDTLPLGVQAKLLRALQEGEVQRLGSNDVRRVNVRVVAASNRDLREEVRAGRFREDLYYRLNVVPLRIPPLRERSEDVPLLVEHFVRADGPRLGRTVEAVAAEAMAALRAYRWPGNVRELRNVVQRALVMSRGEVLRLPGPLDAAASNGHAPAGAADVASAASSAPLADQVRDLKIRLIRAALEESGGNQRIAAERLGMHRQSLTRMLGDLGLRDDLGGAARGDKPARA